MWIAVVLGVAAPVLLLDVAVPSLDLYAARNLPLAILCAQALAMLWLVTPSLRHHFTVSGMDALGFIGIGALMLGAVLWPGPVRDPQQSDGRSTPA